MCGLSGAAGVIDMRVEKACEDLMYMNSLRGDDSTGVAGIPRNLKDPVILAKQLDNPYWVIDTKEYQAIDRMSKRVLMTHNRSATIGDKSTDFAHPWQFKNIVGMHNGTVSLFYTQGLKGSEKFRSDSYGILHSIDQNGVKDTIKDLWGAWALVWYDIRDNTINFLRNTERPLNYTFDEKRETIIWSSEVEMLASAVNRNHIKRKEKSFYVTADTQYKFVIPDYGRPFAEPIRLIVKGKNSQSTYSGGASSNVPFKTKTGKGDGHAMAFDFQGKDDKEFDKDSKNVKRQIPPKAYATEKTIGKDKYPLVYRDDEIRLYYNYQTESFERYWWDKSKAQYNFFAVEKGVIPDELEGDDWKDLAKRGVTKVGTPFGESPNLGPISSPELKENEITVWQGTRVIVKRIKTAGEKEPWVLYRWNPLNKKWLRLTDSQPPYVLPDTLLDVLANHAFKWSGKKKKKKVHYLGFNGKKMTQEDFNNTTKCGCSGCARSPQWTDGRFGGVRVHFYSPKEFLCDWCSRDTHLMEDLKKYGRIGLAATSDSNRPSIN